MAHIIDSARANLAFMDIRSWSAERAAFLVGMALVAVSPIPFALEVGPTILFGWEAMTAGPALALAALALVTGARVLYAMAGIATLAPVGSIILYATGARIIVDPLAGAEFVSQALLLAGALIALPAGLSVLVRERRGTATPLRGIWSRQVGIALAIAALAVGASAAGALATFQTAEAMPASEIGFEPDARLLLVLEDLAFVPSILTVRAGQVTQIDIENRDGVAHTFSYELDGRLFEHELLPRASTTVLLRVDEAGQLTFWCAPHAAPRGDAWVGMVGAILVE